jgi:hypothetical protein
MRADEDGERSFPHFSRIVCAIVVEDEINIQSRDAGKKEDLLFDGLDRLLLEVSKALLIGLRDDGALSFRPHLVGGVIRAHSHTDLLPTRE